MATAPGLDFEARLADERLLERCLAGSGGAREDFSRRFAPLIDSQIRRTAAARGRTLDEAGLEDLRQEVFLALFERDARRLRQFDPARGFLGGWIGRIARQVALKRMGLVLPSPSGLGDADEAVDLSEPAGEGLRNEDIEKLKTALSILPPREALCLALLFDQELAASDVAVLLKVSRQGVYEIRDRALARLRKTLGKIEGSA